MKGTGLPAKLEEGAQGLVDAFDGGQPSAKDQLHGIFTGRVFGKSRREAFLFQAELHRGAGRKLLRGERPGGAMRDGQPVPEQSHAGPIDQCQQARHRPRQDPAMTPLPRIRRQLGQERLVTGKDDRDSLQPGDQRDQRKMKKGRGADVEHIQFPPFETPEKPRDREGKKKVRRAVSHTVLVEEAAGRREPEEAHAIDDLVLRA